MQRVMIIGQPGSGKSTLARAIGQITGLPVVHIDKIHWKAGWKERSRAEKTALCHAIHAEDRWVFEGGHSATWPERCARCDTLIWLDLPLGLRLTRVLWRTLRYLGRTRPDLPDGCPERFSWSFLRWIWDTRQSARTKGARLFVGLPATKTAVRLQSPRAVRRYLSALRAAQRDPNPACSAPPLSVCALPPHNPPDDGSNSGR